MQLSEKQVELLHQLIVLQCKLAAYQAFVANNEQANEQQVILTVRSFSMDIELAKKQLRLED